MGLRVACVDMLGGHQKVNAASGPVLLYIYMYVCRFIYIYIYISIYTCASLKQNLSGGQQSPIHLEADFRAHAFFGRRPKYQQPANTGFLAS